MKDEIKNFCGLLKNRTYIEKTLFNYGFWFLDLATDR